VIHGIVGDEKNFRSDEDKERRETKGDPENGFESGTNGSGREQGGRCHYLPLKWIDVMRSATWARDARDSILISVS
jgi:hypothetical protein